MHNIACTKFRLNSELTLSLISKTRKIGYYYINFIYELNLYIFNIRLYFKKAVRQRIGFPESNMMKWLFVMRSYFSSSFLVRFYKLVLKVWPKLDFTVTTILKNVSCNLLSLKYRGQNLETDHSILISLIQALCFTAAHVCSTWGMHIKYI